MTSSYLDNLSALRIIKSPELYTCNLDIQKNTYINRNRIQRSLRAYTRACLCHNGLTSPFLHFHPSSVQYCTKYRTRKAQSVIPASIPCPIIVNFITQQKRLVYNLIYSPYVMGSVFLSTKQDSLKLCVIGACSKNYLHTLL